MKIRIGGKYVIFKEKIVPSLLNVTLPTLVLLHLQHRMDSFYSNVIFAIFTCSSFVNVNKENTDSCPHSLSDQCYLGLGGIWGHFKGTSWWRWILQRLWFWILEAEFKCKSFNSWRSGAETTILFITVMVKFKCWAAKLKTLWISQLNSNTIKVEGNRTFPSLDLKLHVKPLRSGSGSWRCHWTDDRVLVTCYYSFICLLLGLSWVSLG